MRIKFNYDLSSMNTFRMKVSCACFVEYENVAELEGLNFDSLPRPLLHMGEGSNLLFTGDFPGTVLLLEFLSGERLWCRFCCPQGLLLGAAAWLGARCGRLGRIWSLPVRWQAGSCSCKGEQPCGAVCTLRVQPRRKGGPDPLRCSRCGDCIQTCAGKGKALTWMR